MNTTELPRTLLRTLHATVLAGAVGLAAVACAPTGTPAAASAPAIAAATETVADAAATTAAPAATAPTTTAAATTAAATAATSVVAAAGTGTPAVGAPTVSAKTISPAPVAAAPITAAVVPVAPVPMAVVVPAAAPAAATTTTTPPGGDGVAAQAARAVFDATNTFRQQNGVAPLVWNGALQRSAHQHNLAMATANQMSHQVPGERSFDTRISDQGAPWLSVGENVGFNTNRTVAGALTLHTMMINETAPNDGHKVNKLDPKFNALGVDVLLDPTTGKLWLTEDYAQV